MYVSSSTIFLIELFDNDDNDESLVLYDIDNEEEEEEDSDKEEDAILSSMASEDFIGWAVISNFSLS